MNTNAEASSRSSHNSALLGRLRHELLLELSIAILCAVLAFGVTLKVFVAVVMACMRFAVPDTVTAYLVLKCDPHRGHGFALGSFYVATGVFRAAVAAFILTFGSLPLMPWLNNQLGGNIFGAGWAAAFICTYVQLVAVFPLTLVGMLVAFFSGTKVWYWSGLTKVRRNASRQQSYQEVDVQASLRALALKSAISCALVFFAIPILLNPFPTKEQAEAAAASAFLPLWLLGTFFVCPIVWIYLFLHIVKPDAASFD